MNNVIDPRIAPQTPSVEYTGDPRIDANPQSIQESGNIDVLVGLLWFVFDCLSVLVLLAAVTVMVAFAAWRVYCEIGGVSWPVIGVIVGCVLGARGLFVLGDWLCKDSDFWPLI